MLEPEWLDALPPHDARAQRSRADLRRVNALMGNARHIAAALGDAARIADLGAGDGSLMQSVARRLGRPGIEVVLVDRAAVPDGEAFAPLRWNATAAIQDAHEFLARPGPRFDAVVANLFLHHFEPAPLRRLLELAARRTSLFVACEPRRSRLALQTSRLLGLLGCNDVTRHDAAVSVRAGFLGRELSALWPAQERWQLEERPARPFGHLFVARRDAPL
ncbi:MAG TPA: methyltransferase [Burkholderiales bacterium]